MIKNNFKILKEEKEQILNLVRLPNYRKPFSLLEQEDQTTGGWPALHTAVKKEKKQYSQDILDNYFVNNNKNVPLMDQVVNNIENINDIIVEKIKNGARSASLFGFYNNFLKTLNQQDADIKTLIDTFKSAVETATTKFNSELNVSDHNPLTDPQSTQVMPKNNVGQPNINPINFKYKLVNVCKDTPSCPFLPYDIYAPSITDESSIEVNEQFCKNCLKTITDYVRFIINNKNRNFDIKSIDQSKLKSYKLSILDCWNMYGAPVKNVVGRYTKGKPCGDQSDFKKYFKKLDALPLIDMDTINKLKSSNATTVKIGNQNLTIAEFNEYVLLNDGKLASATTTPPSSPSTQPSPSYYGTDTGTSNIA